QKGRAQPWAILAMLSVVTAFLSALLDNGTTVLLIAPVTLEIPRHLETPPYPFLFAEVFASNIGGTATLIGDPPNIMIGSAAHLSFDAFLLNLAPIAVLVMAVQLLVNHLIWGARMRAAPEDRAHVMALRANDAIEDRRLLFCSTAVIAAAVAAFVFEERLGLEAATIAIFAGAL